jgi:hypothetical protein
MREDKAALFVGVSTRTLYRLRKAGRLAYRELKGTARPVIDYDQEDLELLKAELDQRRTKSRKPGKPPDTSPRITFGLPDREHGELIQEAAQYGMSPGEYARRLVRERLESRLRAETADLQREVKQVRTDLNRLRAEVAGAIEAVLEYVGLPSDEAKRWTTDNLR